MEKTINLGSDSFSKHFLTKTFEQEILELEYNIRSDGQNVVITGDFNIKSPEWGECRWDKRGKIVEEMNAQM